MSPAFAFLGLTILGTWGLASIGLVAGGIILLVAPGDLATSSDNTLGGVVLIAVGLVSFAVSNAIAMPLLGMDPPFPIRAKSIIPASKLTRWVSVGALRDLPDGTPKEVRVKGRRVLIVREGDQVHALNGLCSHARLPMGGFPGSPVKPITVRDGCVTCPFHGARFEVESGKVIRQPFSSEWNNAHPFLGRFQSTLFAIGSKLPAPPGLGLSTKAEATQTYPVRIEGDDVQVALPPRR